MYAKLLSLRRGQLLWILVVGAAALALTDAAAGPRPSISHRPDVTQLAIDGRRDEPLGVDDVAPRLSWRVTGAPGGWMQAAYQIRAARSIEELDRGPYLWNPGPVFSGAQNDIAWGGPTLQSRQRVAWQVRVWSMRGEATDWSAPATWEMGLLERTDWGAARWIEAPGRGVDAPLPLFARAFTLDQGSQPPVTRARLYISATGIYHAELNGDAVTDVPGARSWPILQIT